MRDTILCLCDLTGIMAEPWVEHGYKAVLVDPQHGLDHADGNMLKLAKTVEEAMPVIQRLIDSRSIAFMAGFPPCTDMAVSGAQWFPRKYEEDHLFQAKAVMVAEQCRTIGRASGAPWMVENPVSVLAGAFGKPDYTFDPYEFTAFEPDDNYTKKTCLWTGGDSKCPPPAWTSHWASRTRTVSGMRAAPTGPTFAARPHAVSHAPCAKRTCATGQNNYWDKER